MELIDIMKQRHACKAMNGEIVPQEKINRILEAIRLAPTSSGLQPFEIIEITNQEIKDQIRKISFNQSVVSDCSHLLIFAAWDNYTPERINYMFDLHNEIRGTKEVGWENYRQQLLNIYPKQLPEINYQHTAKQAYIAFSFAIMAVATEGLDCTPMEGFLPNELDTLLGLKEKGLRSTLLLPIGYRDEEKDWAYPLKKVRVDMDKLVTKIS